MAGSTIIVERRGGVARVTLDRPERRNAVSLALVMVIASCME